MKVIYEVIKATKLTDCELGLASAYFVEDGFGDLLAITTQKKRT